MALVSKKRVVSAALLEGRPGRGWSTVWSGVGHVLRAAPVSHLQQCPRPLSSAFLPLRGSWVLLHWWQWDTSLCMHLLHVKQLLGAGCTEVGAYSFTYIFIQSLLLPFLHNSVRSLQMCEK